MGDEWGRPSIRFFEIIELYLSSKEIGLIARLELVQYLKGK